MRKKKNKRKKMTQSNFLCGLFLSSGVLDTFVSIFVNCQAVSFSLHVWLGFVASLAIIRVIHNYGKFKVSTTIPK